MVTRVRIKVPSKRGDTVYFASVKEGLSSCPGVVSVDTNPQTAGILVVHSGEMKSLADYAKAKNLFVLNIPKTKPRSLMSDVAATFKSYNDQLKKMTGGELDIPSLVFLSLIVSGVYQIIRGNLGAPAWYTAFYYALGVFTHSMSVDELDESQGPLDTFDEEGSENSD
jgi:hypothetical protein